MKTKTISSLYIRLLILPVAAVQIASALGPYTPDAQTSFLYHLDEAAQESMAINEGQAGYSAVSYDGAWPGDGIDQLTITTSLGASAFPGFGNAATLTESTGIGVDLNGDGGFRTNDANPISPDRFPNHTEILADSFTLEAMVSVNSITTDTPQLIISTDSFGDLETRGIQFRIAAGELQFYFIGSAPGNAVATIPLTGDHAFTADAWFHTAVSFDGSMLRFYWTRVAESSTEANEIGTATHSIDLTDGGPLTIGNEGRVTGSFPPLGLVVSNAGLQGLMDEVRISTVVRGPKEFIFAQDGLKNTEITGINVSADGLQVSFTWTSEENTNYVIEASSDLDEWETLDALYPSEGEQTSFTEEIEPDLDLPKRFYRVSVASPIDQ